MKALYILLLCAVVIGATSCQTHPHYEYPTKVRTTAYTHTESDHVKYGRQTAIGTQLKRKVEYSSAACDWSFLPVGTTFTIAGDPHKYVIDDYGSALVGTQTIDIYCPSRRLMNEWGVKLVDINVEDMGDYQRSLLVLQDRSKYPHIRQMIASIKQKI